MNIKDVEIGMEFEVIKTVEEDRTLFMGYKGIVVDLRGTTVGLNGTQYGESVLLDGRSGKFWFFLDDIKKCDNK